MKTYTSPLLFSAGIFLWSLITLLPSSLIPQKVQADTENPYCSYRTRFEKLIVHNTQQDSAYKVVQEAIRLCKKRKDSLALAYFYTAKGAVLDDLQPENAFRYYFKAREILEPRGPSEHLATLYRELARSLGFKDPQRLRFLHKSLSVLKKLQHSDKKVFNNTKCRDINSFDSLPVKTAYLYNLITYYHLRNNNDSVRYYTKQGLDLSKDIDYKLGEAYCYIFLGLINRKDGNLDSALYYLKRTLRVEPGFLESQKIAAQRNIMNVFFRKNMPDSAFYYYDNFKDKLSAHPSLAKKTYGDLVSHYRNQNNYHKAFLYKAKEDSLRAYLDQNQNNSAYKVVAMENETRLKQAQLKKTRAQVQQAEQQRLFLLLLLAIGLLSAGLIFYQIKQKNRKKREILEARQKLADSELKNSKLQNQQLAERLKYSNNELASFAARTVKNKEILNEVKDRVTQALRKREPQKIKDVLKELHVMLLQMLHKDEDQRQKIVERAENINSELLYSLRMHFPRLSDNDLNLLVLLLLKFNSKEIASIYQIEERSVVKRRYRLRKRLNIGKYESFEDFLHRLLADEDLIRHAKVSGADYSSNEGDSLGNPLKKT